MNKVEAEQLISRALDGEISSDEAALLQAYLDEHPEAENLKQSWEAIGAHLREESVPCPDVGEAWADIEKRISSEPSQAVEASETIVSFPFWLKPLVGLAAVGVLGFSLLHYLSPPSSIEEADVVADYGDISSTVEFVDTDIEGASPIVYVDEDWTIVWIIEPN